MSTKKTEKTEITSNTTNDKKVSDNKAVFGPLGKYAVVAVIMVSIIVTTAIVLDKELGTAEEKLAAVENEVAAANAVDEETVAKVESSEATASIEVIAETDEAQGTTELAEIETVPVNVQTTEAAEVQVDEAKVLVAIKANSTQAAAKIESASIDTKAKKSVQDSQTLSVAGKQNKEWLARIESYKLEQKQHMTEMFARIKALDSKQLDQYKAHQDKRIERLREQIVQQQQMIETLILRNKEGFDMRAASMQRHQAKREQMLNRI